MGSVSYTHLRAHETEADLVCRLLLDLCKRYKKGAPLKRFNFRAMSPVFDGEEIGICGIENEGKGRLWIRGPAGEMAMSAEASW